MQGHHAVLIKNKDEARCIMNEIGVSSEGQEYMLPKTFFHCLKLKNIPCKAANLIKQEMLSKGGEAAVSKNTLFAEGFTDILLMGNLKQYRQLINKLKIQPFGLKELAEEVDFILKALDIKERNIQLANGQVLELGQRTLIMGILNVTPDSFSDGGNYLDPELAFEHALKMKEEGADIIDIGGASSRPGTVIASEEEELQRILPVIKKLADQEIIISVDTFRGKVAQQALDNGAHIINDIGRLQLDHTLLDVLLRKQAPVILMHNHMQMQQEDLYEDFIADIVRELKTSIAQAVDAGLKAEKIIVDPGIGFGKTAAQNRLLIKSLAEFKSLNCPVLLGTSRKSFIGQTLGLEVDQRLEGSLATVAMGIMNGADILRVHDVKESKRAAMMTDAVMRENG